MIQSDKEEQLFFDLEYKIVQMCIHINEYMMSCVIWVFKATHTKYVVEK